MKIAEIYSHLNGEEYLIVHHKSLYNEINKVINDVNANALMTKISKEKTMRGKMLYNPIALNKTFNEKFRKLSWNETRYKYYVTTDRKYMEEMLTLSYQEQKEFLISKGITSPISSYKQTDFVKNRIAVEVQFGKYAFVAFDLFVKHLLFYSGGIINVGVEILPIKKMQSIMSSGVAYYEGEVYNILRHGRSNPPVPLLIIGIEP
ncbi:MAG: restriction endonuclease [Ignavibacteria bacterium GWA2_35_9]|nr:MAG: restriction endonuclease [Ignavibacteria bacterium GWA2_35_9]OGU51579.1 MAG: restriction endonuclease [Ignavibacteria bacterium GWC2_36_12]